MAGLFSTLNSTVMALSAHSRAIETTGKNLANVNNTEYARQRIIYGDRGTVVTPDGAESLGMEALGVQQLRDSLLDRQVIREIATNEAYTAERDAYQRAQAALGQSIDRTSAAGVGGSSGISTAIDDFFNAFQSFAGRPTDVGERQSLLQKAAILVDRINFADDRLAQVQSDLDASIASDVSEVNRLLSVVADLNAQIGRFETNAPGSAVDLRDQRQARLEELAGLIAFTVKDQPGGQLQVIAKDGGGADVVLVDLASVTGPVTFDGTQIKAGTPATTLALGGGSIKGTLDARDGSIQTLRDDLDALSAQLVAAVNAAYNPTTATGDFFNAAGVTAATLSLATGVTATTLKASDGGPAGDNTVALAIAGLATKKFATSGGDSIDGSFSGFFSQTVSRIGQALSGATSRVSDQENIKKLVSDQRNALSGVSLDEEMANLMKFQRSFQASSRVFQTVDALLEVVVERLGR